MSGDQLTEGVTGATVVVANDYEFEILKQKTGLNEKGILAHSRVLVVTRGAHGSTVITAESRTDVPAVPPRRVVDPTGVGDAFRGGFMKGLILGLPYTACAQLGSVAATYVLEHLGGQSHSYSWEEFKTRHAAHFGRIP
jgi:adenosine kinase